MADLDALLAELEAGRDRAATLTVLADALVERGDPRGELIHVQRALTTAAPGERAALERRSHELVGELRTRVLGELAGQPEIELDYRDGFLHRVAVSESPAGYSMGDALARVLASPDARFLHEIAIDPTEEADLPRPIATVLERLQGVSMPRSLRRVELGRALARNQGYRVFGDYGSVAFEDDLSALLDVFTDVMELRVDLGAVLLQWAPLVSTQLKQFAYVSPYVRLEEIETLAASRLPALEAFELWTGASYLVNEEMDLYAFEDLDDADQEREPDFDDQEAIAVRELEPILAMLDATAVTSVGFPNFAFDPGELVTAIAAHPFGHRLERLDLGRGLLVSSLPASIGQLPALRTLVLDHVELARAAFPTLASRLPALRAARGPERYRYVITME